MASATGTTVTLQSNAYQGRYMKLTCNSTQDVANNKTNISWTLESIGGSSGHYATICRLYFSWYVNGSRTEICAYSIDKGYSYDAFPVTKGQTTGSISVPMESDGNKTIYVDMDVAIYTSSTTRYSVTDGWKLNTVPRYPTISTFTVSKVSGSSTSLSASWSGSAPGGTINKVEYSKDNGSNWTTASTASATSGTFTISGLSSNTGYNCKLRVTNSASGLTATSGAVYQSTYQQPTANISTANISGYSGITQIKVSWSSNMTISNVQYSKDNGSTWYNAGNPNSTSGNYTYTGLSENTAYNFKVKVTASTGSCVTTSATSSRTTYKRVSGNLYVNGTKVATSNGQTGVALKNGDTLAIKDITNNAGCSYKIFFENPDNQNWWASSAVTGTTELSMTAEQVRQRLQYMTSTNSQGFNVGIVTMNGSTNALYYEFYGTLSVVNSNPTFTTNNWTYQDTNTNTVALTGSNQILVNGFSKLRVNIGTAATGVNYATISQYTVSGCTSGSSTTTGNIDCATPTNGGTIKVTAKDSRSNSTETTKTATFKDYFVPTLSSITATRNNGGVGTQTSLTFNGTWWNANFGASANTLTAIYRYKSGSTWSEARAITLTTSGNTYSFTTSQLYGDLNADGFTLGTTFTIEVTITDELNGGKSWTTVLNSGTPAIAISGNNVSIGAQYDTSLDGKLQVHGNIQATGVTISKMNNRPFAIAGSDNANTSGWYKICSSTMGGYGNTNIIWVVSNNYATEQKGILNLEMRSNNGSIQCWALKWLVRSGFGADYARLTISGNTWTLYFYKSNAQYGRVTFHEIMHNGIGDKDGYTVTYYSSNTPESTAPTANTTSSDGGRVSVANSADSATTASKLSRALGSGTIAQTTIMDISGSTDGLMLTYEAGTSDIGVSKLYTTDDANARLELGNNVSGTYKRAFHVENGVLYIDNNGSWTRNTSDTWIPVVSSGRLDYAPRKFFTTQTHTDYNNNQDNLVTMSVLTYWNGAYNSSGSSNLTRAHQGVIQCKPTSLYDNSSGSTGTITLSQTAANFTYLTIFYRESKNQQSYGSVWLYSPNGKYARQQIIEKAGTDMRFNTTRGVISGTSITRDYGAVDYLNGAKYDVQEMWIVKVIGWK